MITLEPNKKKTIKFSTETKGLDPRILEYTLKLHEKNYEIGIKGHFDSGDVIFQIPALKNILSESATSNIKKVTLEIIDKYNNYFVRAFEDTVKVKMGPSIKTEKKEEIFEPDYNLNENHVNNHDNDIPLEKIQKEEKKVNDSPKNINLKMFLNKEVNNA